MIEEITAKCPDCEASLIWPKSVKRTINSSDSKIEFHLSNAQGQMNDLSKWIRTISLSDYKLGVNHTPQKIRHEHFQGYDDEWKWLRENLRPKLTITSWRIVVFFFLTEQALRMMNWQWEPVSKTDALKWLRSEAKKLQMFEMFEDKTFILEDDFLRNMNDHGVNTYIRCENGCIKILVPTISELVKLDQIPYICYF